MPVNVLDIIRDGLEIGAEEDENQQVFWSNMQLASILLALSNSLMKPLIYAGFSNKMRQVIYVSVRVSCCIKNNVNKYIVNFRSHVCAQIGTQYNDLLKIINFEYIFIMESHKYFQ